MATIEYALSFEVETDEVHEVVAIQKPQPQNLGSIQKIQDSLDQIVKRLETLKTRQQPVPRTQQYYGSQRRRQQDQRDGETELRC